MSRTERRLLELVRARRFFELRQRGTLAQADAIALHYLRVMNLARDLRELIKARDIASRLARDITDADNCIAFCLEQLKTAHREDLGLELDWRIEGEK